MSYLCEDGSGESATKLLKYLQICDIKLCEKECTKEQKCHGFDFTKTCQLGNCRLFIENTKSNDGGDDERKYCTRTESKTIYIYIYIFIYIYIYIKHAIFIDNKHL